MVTYTPGVDYDAGDVCVTGRIDSITIPDGTVVTATYDAIVLGLGGFGSATILNLARRGLNVLGLDRFSSELRRSVSNPLLHQRYQGSGNSCHQYTKH